MREMMRDEERFNRESVHITLQAAILIDSKDDYQKKLDAARCVEVFQKKRHKLAWTFLNTMNNFHHCHICTTTCYPTTSCCIFRRTLRIKSTSDLRLGHVGNFNDLKESLYIHESQEAKTRIMQRRWWIASELNYVLPLLGNTRDVDFEWRPKFTPKIETFAVDKISLWIYGGHLSLKYYNRYHKEESRDDVFNHSTMDQVFQHSLEQLYKDDPDQRATLNQIVNCFMDTPFNWLVPNIGNML
jgi:hypothetical protein